MAESTEDSSLLSKLVESASGTATETITSGLIGAAGNAILSALGISGNDWEDLAEQLNRIEALENQILDELGDIKEEIKTAIDASQMTDGESKIRGNYLKMKSLIVDLNPDKGIDPASLKRDYNTLADDVYESIPTAIEQIDQHATDFMDALLKAKRDNHTDIFKYNIILCHALSEICRTFSVAKELMIFSLAAHRTLDNIISTVDDMVAKLQAWKAGNIDGPPSRMVAALLNEGTTNFVINNPVVCYGDLSVTEPGKSDGAYWLSPKDAWVKTIPCSKDDKTEKRAERAGGFETEALIVEKVEDFEPLTNATLKLKFHNSGYIGVADLVITSDVGETGLNHESEYYDDGDELWEFRCCLNNSIETPALRNFFSFYHKDTKKYVIPGEEIAIIKDFSDDDQQQFWGIL